MITNNIEALIRDLSGLQKDIQLEDLFGKAATDLRPTADRFEVLEQALEGVKELGLFGGNDPRDLHLLKTVGEIYERLLHLEGAQETFEDTLALADRVEDPSTRAAVLHRLGRVLSLWNRWEESLHHLDLALDAYRELDDKAGQAKVLVERGVVFHEQGDYDTASDLYQEALVLAQQGGTQGVVAYASNNLAVLATIRGDFEEAETQYSRCLEIYEEIEDSREAARTHHNLGMTHARQEAWQEATKCFSRSFEIARQNQQMDVMANVYLSQAELLLNLGDSSIVTLCCVRALEIYRKVGDRLGEADAYRLLGRVFTLRKQWSTADALFADSLRLNEEFRNPLGTAEARRDLGQMQAARGYETDARASFEDALERFQTLRARTDVQKVQRLIEALRN